MGKRSLYNSGEVTKIIQRSLKKSKQKYDTYGILLDIKNSIESNFNNTDINIILEKTELNIFTNKKKNNHIKEIKELIFDELDNLVDDDYINLLFDINCTKTNIIIKCKRKIEH